MGWTLLARKSMQSVELGSTKPVTSTMLCCAVLYCTALLPTVISPVETRRRHWTGGVCPVEYVTELSTNREQAQSGRALSFPRYNHPRPPKRPNPVGVQQRGQQNNERPTYSDLQPRLVQVK